MPVIPMPRVVLQRWRMPSASAAATERLTAPSLASSSGGTPQNSRFNWSEYTSAPPMKYREEPLTRVMRSASRPPVQLSATDSVAPRIWRK